MFYTFPYICIFIASMLLPGSSENFKMKYNGVKEVSLQKITRNNWVMKDADEGVNHRVRVFIERSQIIATFQNGTSYVMDMKKKNFTKERITWNNIDTILCSAPNQQYCIKKIIRSRKRIEFIVGGGTGTQESANSVIFTWKE